MQRVWAVRVGVLVVVLIAVGGVLTNYATESRPAWLADPVRVWLALVVVMVLLALLGVLASRWSSEPGMAGVPRFGPVPGSLELPALDRPVRGRDADLDRLRALSQVPGGRFVVLCGAGDMGKTALAMQFAHQAAAEGRRVFWIRHRSAAQLAGRFEEIAVATGLPREVLARAQRSNADSAGVVWAQLNRVPGWVIVVDNLDQPADAAPPGEPLWEYRGWIRPSSSGLLVVTSRDSHRDSWGSAALTIAVGPLSDADGATVLVDAAPHAGAREEAAQLSGRLGGLPLALRAAGNVLAEPTSRYRTITSYLAALDERATTLLPQRPNVADPEVIQRLVGYTWDLSLDQLAADGITLATPVLRLLSQFAEAPIPRSLLTPDLLTAATGRAVTLAEVDAAVAGLHRYGLIDIPTQARTLQIPTVALHPVVRETTAIRIAQDDPGKPLRSLVDTALTSAVHDVVHAGRGGWDTAELLVPHLLALRDLTATGPAFLDARNTLNELADVLGDAGRGHSELGLRRAVLAAEAKVLGPNHPDTLKSRNNLAYPMYRLGRYQEAADLHRQTLAICERVLGPDHPDTLKSRRYLAGALGELGRHQEAADMDRATLANYERVLGPDHPDTLKSRNNLAIALYRLGRYQEGADLHRETLTIYERVLGPDHPDTLLSRNNLAVSLSELGEHEQARALNQDTLTTSERVLGPDHPDTLLSRNNLAFALYRLGQHQEAADLHRETLTIYERVLGAAHPDTLLSRNNLAGALHARGQYQEAADVMREALTICERVLGPHHPDTLLSRDNLAIALRVLGRYRKAANLNRETLAICERVLGPDHPETLTSRNNLADTLHARGWYRDATNLHRETLAICERVLGPDHPHTLNSRNNLANVLHARGWYQEAADLHRETLAICERVLGADDPNTLSSRNNLALTLHLLGRHQEAADLHRETLATRQHVLGPAHPDTLNSRDNLANALEMLKWNQSANRRWLRWWGRLRTKRSRG